MKIRQFILRKYLNKTNTISICISHIRGISYLFIWLIYGRWLSLFQNIVLFEGYLKPIIFSKLSKIFHLHGNLLFYFPKIYSYT